MKLASGDQWRQFNQLQEECGELIAAVNQYRRNKSIEHLYDEIADVAIMIAQMRVILDNSKINAKIEEKLSRAAGRLSEGKL
jgi:NTP pyrophosphatase (non-canonical NTP hydrolase)